MNYISCLFEAVLDLLVLLSPHLELPDNCYLIYLLD